MSMPIHKWHTVDLPLQYFSVFLLLTYIENIPYSPLYLLHTLDFCYLCLVVSQHYGLFFTDSMKCLMSLWFFCWRISYTQRFETLSSRRAKVLHTLHAQCRLGFFFWPAFLCLCCWCDLLTETLPLWTRKYAGHTSKRFWGGSQFVLC